MKVHVRRRGRGWVYVIERGTYPPGHPKAGKRWQEWGRQHPTEADAHMAGARRLVELGLGIRTNLTSLTLGEWLTEWLEHVDVNPATHHNYSKVVRLHLVNSLGSVKLSDLSHRHIQQWQTRQMKTLSSNTVNQQRRVLDVALNQAVKAGLLASNPSQAVKRPRQTGRTGAWDEQQAAAVLDATTDMEQRVCLRILLTTGIRLGELLALRWADIDLGAGALVIQRRRHWTAEGWAEAEGTKGGGARRIELDPASVNLLKQWSVEQKKQRLRSPLWRDHDLVLTARHARGGVLGGHLSEETVRRWIRQAAERAGVPPLSPHGLRHTWATIALTRGVPVTVVSQRLGHASPVITLEVYAHLLPSADRLAVELMGEVYDERAEGHA